MAVSASSTSVVIHSEEYSILSAPSKTSKIVMVEGKALINTLDLETLVQDLAQVGGFIKIAYNATAAAPACREIHELQKDIVRLGYDITDLCSKSVITVANFSSTTRTILEELQAAYEFLLDGFEDMAIDSIACLSDLAGKMAQAALKLKEEFDKQAKAVQLAAEKASDVKQKSEEENEKAKHSQANFKRLIDLEEEAIKEAADLEEQSREERKKYEKKADDEIDKIGDPTFLEVTFNAVTTIATVAVGGVAGAVVLALESSESPGTGTHDSNAAANTPGTGTHGSNAAAKAPGTGTHGSKAAEKIPGTGTHGSKAAKTPGTGTLNLHGSNAAAKMKADEFNKKAQRKLELEMEQRKLRQERKQKQAEFLNDLQSTKITEIDTENAKKFLHQALNGLRGLSVVMQKAAAFWTMLQMHCQTLAEDSIKSMIEKGMERYSEEKRMKIWTSTAFKTKAISYSAKWVALNSMCEKHMEMIRITQRDLYNYIKDNPTREEAQQSLPGLLKKYAAGLKREQEKSEKDCAELQKQIEENSSSNSPPAE